MSGSSQTPAVARVEDYDSDESDVRPGTAVEAKSATMPRQPGQPRQRRQGPPEATSDSGYSSHSGGLQRTVINQPPKRRDSQRSPTKISRPIIHKNDSLHTSRSSSRSVSKARCTDPNCKDPKCASSNNAERRFTMPEQDRVRYAQQMTHMQQNAVPAYQTTARPPQATVPTMAPPPQPRPRPRGLSGTQNSRPASFHAGMVPYQTNYAYSNAQYGAQPQYNVPSQYTAPPSPSQYNAPYYNQQYQQSQAYQQYSGAQLGGMYGNTPPNGGPIGQYPGNVTSSPIRPSPPSPILNNRPALPHTVSARNPIGSYDMPVVQRTVSQRQTSARAAPVNLPMPGTYQDSTSGSSGSESASSSESESDSQSESEDERQRARQERARKLKALRDRQAMPPPPVSRRPSVKESRPSFRDRHTVPVITSRNEREPFHRAPHSDPHLDYPSDQIDSDRTQHAVVDRAMRRDRSSTYSSSNSRRPSVSTTASSQRTKATTLSSGSGSRDGAMLVIEDGKGRRRAYLSKDQEAELMRRYQQQRLEENVEAYQKAAQGMTDELTAENIKKQNRRASMTGSHSGGQSMISKRSHRSSHSNQVSNTDSQSIQIRSGETILHISGGAQIEVRPGEDGGPASFVIASGNGKEDKYHGGSSSRSSGGSRVGRSRTGSQMGRRHTIHEEDGYEPAI